MILFLGVAIAPSIHAYINEQSNSLKRQDENYITFLVRRLKPDGSIEKYTVQLSKDKTDEYYNKIKNANTINERLEIHKSYGLIPENVIASDLKRDLYEKLNNSDYRKLSMNNILSLFNQYDRFVLVINSNCEVSGFAGKIPVLPSRGGTRISLYGVDLPGQWKSTKSRRISSSSCSSSFLALSISLSSETAAPR